MNILLTDEEATLVKEFLSQLSFTKPVLASRKNGKKRTEIDWWLVLLSTPVISDDQKSSFDVLLNQLNGISDHSGGDNDRLE
jgi:hypothetical protein